MVKQRGDNCATHQSLWDLEESINAEGRRRQRDKGLPLVDKMSTHCLTSQNGSDLKEKKHSVIYKT